MNTIIKSLLMSGALLGGAALTGCNDYLDVTPPSSVSPELYFTDAEQLGYYTIKYYDFPSHYDYDSYIHNDGPSDNEGTTSDIYYEGSDYKVSQTGGEWYFNTINALNWFIAEAEAKFRSGQVQGNQVAARHYIGEGYMLRAYEYFYRLKKLGDFPIITESLPDDREVLSAASRRAPRNMVARFILADLDSAIKMCSDASGFGGRSRITRDAALLMKARVALYEATWEKYFAGTPFVPDAAAGWAGAKKDYNKDFSYDNQAEVRFFLDEALAASKQVADAHKLEKNNKKEQGVDGKFSDNPYYDMFASVDVRSYDEVLMFREYNRDKGVQHSTNGYMRSGQSRGYTQEFANAFLMENGLPIYAEGSDYAGDDWVADTKKNRDWRWRLFMKAPGEQAYADTEEIVGDGKNKNVPQVYNSAAKYATSTGYKKSKCWTKSSVLASGYWQDYTAAVVFRAAEAYLIYMEAAWEKYGDNLDPDAWKYWAEIRKRAGVDEDIQKTIAATDLDKEEYYTHDLGLYSGGRRIESKVLYNIRRERRCELMSEGFRIDDLYRWRSYDQLIGGKYFLHGAKIFGPMQGGYAKGKLKYDQAKDTDNNVSSPSDTEGGLNGDARYLCMWRVSKDNKFYETGYTWHMAHYLSPIAVEHFLLSSPDGVSIDDSPIYQNPWWGTVSSTPAQK